MTTKKISKNGRSARALARREPNPRQRILVVEDDADVRQVNTEVLRYSGYHVDTAEDGAAAWGMVQLNNYDLLITDNHMPKVTGVELLQKIHNAHIILPVIMATGTLPQKELLHHPGLQIEATLLKPYTFGDLLGTVKNILHAIAEDRAEIAPPPNWQGQPSTSAGSQP
jgi:two-component system, chemotaxis family, chemotaxis protein CheY